MKRIKEAVVIFFRSFGQIMLQASGLTGLFFVLGITAASPLMAAGGALAVLAANLWAYKLKYPRDLLKKGFFGFSPALVGVAVVLFLQPAWYLPLVIVVGAVLAAAIQRFFAKIEVAVFTLPFVLVTWGIWWVAHTWWPELMQGGGADPLVKELLYFPLLSYGQVIFQGSALAGLLFLAGVGSSNLQTAIFGLAGGTLASVVALWVGVDMLAVGQGLWGFNAVLCAITFAGKRRMDFIWAGAAVALALFVGALMQNFALPQLTFPFVAGSVMTLALKERVG